MWNSRTICNCASLSVCFKAHLIRKPLHAFRDARLSISFKSGPRFWGKDMHKNKQLEHFLQFILNRKCSRTRKLHNAGIDPCVSWKVQVVLWGDRFRPENLADREPRAARHDNGQQILLGRQTTVLELRGQHQQHTRPDKVSNNTNARGPWTELHRHWFDLHGSSKWLKFGHSTTQPSRLARKMLWSPETEWRAQLIPPKGRLQICCRLF